MSGRLDLGESTSLLRALVSQVRRRWKKEGCGRGRRGCELPAASDARGCQRLSLVPSSPAFSHCISVHINLSLSFFWSCYLCPFFFCTPTLHFPLRLSELYLSPSISVWMCVLGQWWECVRLFLILSLRPIFILLPKPLFLYLCAYVHVYVFLLLSFYVFFCLYLP